MRNALRDIIREQGLSPEPLMQMWASWVERGVRAWLESGHLTAITIEFFEPGASTITTRWDFPVEYTSSGVDDDMWMDKPYLRQLIAKAPQPTASCKYRVLLWTAPGKPKVDGIGDTSCLATGQLIARPAGTIVATGHIMASATYWT
jgi:Bacterial HORMA domain 2